MTRAPSGWFNGPALFRQLRGIDRRLAILESGSPQLARSRFVGSRGVIHGLDNINGRLLDLGGASDGTPSIWRTFFDSRIAGFITDFDARLVAVESAGDVSSPYVAQAVHFDGGVTLSIDSLLAMDNGLVGFSFWLKVSAFQNNDVYIFSTPIPENSPQNTNGIRNTHKFVMGFDSEDFGSNLYCASANVLTTGTWLNFIGASQTDLSGGSKIIKLYLNDTDVTASISDAFDSFVPAFNGQSFVIGAGVADNYIGDLADVWIGPGVSLLTGSEIVEATRRLFINADGKPVNPSGFPASAILFSGDSAGFPVNQGTGGSFTLTGPEPQVIAGHNGTGRLDLVNIPVGTVLASVVNDDDENDLSFGFENIISISNSVAQYINEDWSGIQIRFSFVPAISDADTSPSD